MRLLGVRRSAIIALVTGAGMIGEWPHSRSFGTRRTPWAASSTRFLASRLTSSCLGCPLAPVSGWLLTLAVIICAVAVFFFHHRWCGRVCRPRSFLTIPWRGLSIAFAFLLLILAMRVYLSRFDLLLEHHTVFSGVTYTDAHVTLTGLLLVCFALILGAMVALANAMRWPRGRWLLAAVLPAILCFAGVRVTGW